VVKIQSIIRQIQKDVPSIYDITPTVLSIIGYDEEDLRALEFDGEPLFHFDHLGPWPERRDFQLPHLNIRQQTLLRPTETPKTSIG